MLSDRNVGVEAVTKTEMAYRRIRQEILRGDLGPGSSLDQEALALRLGLSTTPVREALRRLETEQLVVSRAHRETVVAPLAFSQLEETYAVRLSLDPLAVSFAAAKASDEQLKAMQDLADRYDESADPVRQLDYNRLLHRAMYSACGNAVLVEILDLLWDRSDRYRLITLHDQGTATSAQHEHRAIVEALAARDSTRAAALMSEHVGESLQKIRQTPSLAE